MYAKRDRLVLIELKITDSDFSDSDFLNRFSSYSLAISIIMIGLFP